MAKASDTFGFEILHKLYQNEMQKKEDVIILFAHWYLVKCGLRCIGIGDNVSFDQNATLCPPIILKFVFPIVYLCALKILFLFIVLSTCVLGDSNL